MLWLVVGCVLLVPVACGVRRLVVLLAMNARLICAVALAILFSLPGFAQTKEQILAQTGLDPDLVAVLTVEGSGGKVLFVFVYLSEQALGSRIRPDLAEKLTPYVGQNAILVWAYSEAGASFDPNAIWFAQGGERFILSSNIVVPMEGDFLSGKLSPATPVAAVVMLGEAIDPAQGFEIHYGEAVYATLAVTEGKAIAAAQVTAKAQPGAQAQAEAKAVEPKPAPCPQPCPGDPCAWLTCWWTCACDPCGPGFILPLLLLLLLGL